MQAYMDASRPTCMSTYIYTYLVYIKEATSKHNMHTFIHYSHIHFHPLLHSPRARNESTELSSGECKEWIKA